MTPDEHLRLLRVFHFATAGLQALGLVMLGILLLVSLASGRGPALAIMWIAIACFAVAMLVINLMAARRLPTGGRTLSIIAGCLSLPSAPIGTAFGIYVFLVHFNFAPESS